MTKVTVVAVLLALSVMPATAQSSYTNYTKGYNDGDNLHYPPNGLPDYSSDYGRGFHEGLEDLDEEMDNQQQMKRNRNEAAEPE